MWVGTVCVFWMCTYVCVFVCLDWGRKNDGWEANDRMNKCNPNVAQGQPGCKCRGFGVYSIWPLCGTVCLQSIRRT